MEKIIQWWSQVPVSGIPNIIVIALWVHILCCSYSIFNTQAANWSTFLAARSHLASIHITPVLRWVHTTYPGFLVLTLAPKVSDWAWAVPRSWVQICFSNYLEVLQPIRILFVCRILRSLWGENFKERTGQTSLLCHEAEAIDKENWLWKQCH